MNPRLSIVIINLNVYSNFMSMDSWNSFFIRKAQTKDIESVCELFKTSVSTLCSKHYSNEEITYWNSNKTPEKIRSWIENENFHFLVAERSGELFGLGFIDFKTGIFYACYIHPSAVNLGLGKHIANLMIERVKKCKLPKVTLMASRNAEQFYLKLGFQITETAYDLQPPVGIPHAKMELNI